MKKTLLFLSVLVFHFVNAQQPQMVRCMDMNEHEKFLEAKDPNRKAMRDSAVRMMNRWIANQSLNRTARVETQYTIPIVFHVVWNTSQEQISIQQIKTQVKVLNQDYNRQNADRVNTPAAFASSAANCHITFCLATVDPGWHSTTGVVYTHTSVASFGQDDHVKMPVFGGDTIWDPHRYLNIWICNLSGGLLGYSEFPTPSLDNTFGSVINYQAVGDSGYLPYSQYNLGRTVTHEIGHLLDLIHPWADDGGACPGADDGCADTPPEGNANHDAYCSGNGPTFGKPPFPYVDNCSTVSPGIMVENFMEYTDDAEMNLFTNNQYSRMLGTIAGPLAQLVASNACSTLGINEITFGNEINIYPNPSSSGFFNVQIGLTNIKHVNVEVYNIMGQMLDSWSSDNVANTTYDLNLSHQPNGLYFAKIYNNEFSVVKKIMINK